MKQHNPKRKCLLNGCNPSSTNIFRNNSNAVHSIRKIKVVLSGKKRQMNSLKAGKSTSSHRIACIYGSFSINNVRKITVVLAKH